MKRTTELVVQTRQGAVRGATSGGGAAFKGIPYAAPPVGAHRFQAPRAPEPWDGVRDATGYGPTAPQNQYPAPFDALLANPIIPGDDYLNLNVWTPEPGGARLPVMVWIHGGAFVAGSGAVPWYDGSAFARDGIVCVTINYRLGVEGFASIEGAPPNRGLLDQVAALEWVRDNIAGFGGDPDNVTIFGESAGAMSVGTLLSLPRTRGLFRRAIAQSGAGHHVISTGAADRVAAMLGARLGVPPTREGLTTVGVRDLLDAQAQLSQDALLNRDAERWGEVAQTGYPWQVVVDGDVLPARPIDAVAGGAGPAVDLLVGTNRDEWNFWYVPTGAVDAIDDRLAGAMAAGYGLPPRGLDVYRAARPGAVPGAVLAAVITDWFFRIPALRLAEANVGRGQRSHVYELTWPSPAFGGRLGACHALDLPFVFDTLGSEKTDALTGPEPPRALATAMHGAWTMFARTGDPGWPSYEPGRRLTMRFGETSEVVDDPSGAERELWEGIR
ncbi:MAG TPA: carboxylesterase family protein [Candidatus Dormibacteraeota bacterium]|nr:carboxylesterase family protein [Candidatus Dormibacteraeota bacterium]